MNNISPLPLTIAVAVLVTGLSLLLRRYGYGSYDKQSHMGVVILPDTGFRMLPDWSHHTVADDVLVIVISVLFFVWMTLHTHRRVMWRRSMLIWSVVQVIAMVCFVSTQLPDPRSECKNFVCKYLRFSMHIVVYALVPLTVSYYTTSPALSGASWFVCTNASFVAIACREYYTVDVLSSYYVTILTFILYMWYVRGPQSIRKRPILQWFEADALDETVPLNNEGFSHFPNASFAPNVLDRMEEECVNHASGYTPHQQYKHIALTTLTAGCINGGAAALMFAINAIANNERPLGKDLPDPLMEALGHLNIPQDAAGYLLYTLMGSVIIAAMFHEQRFAIIRRNAFTFGILLLLRGLTVGATFPPDPSPDCVSRDHAPSVTCGDLIFSGHTVVFLLSSFIVKRYWNNVWATAFVSVYTTVGLLVVIGSKLHYTRDVLIAIVVTGMIYNVQYTMYMDRVDRVLQYSVLEWFERDYYFVLANKMRRGSIQETREPSETTA